MSLLAVLGTYVHLTELSWVHHPYWEDRLSNGRPVLIDLYNMLLPSRLPASLYSSSNTITWQKSLFPRIIIWVSNVVRKLVLQCGIRNAAAWASARIKNSWQRLLLAGGWIMQWGPSSQNTGLVLSNSVPGCPHLGYPGTHLDTMGPYGFITHNFNVIHPLNSSDCKFYTPVLQKLSPQVTHKLQLRNTLGYIVVICMPIPLLMT